MKVLLAPSALLLLAAIVTRYPPVGRLLPEEAGIAIAALVGAVFLVVGVIERHTPRGAVGPLWMRVSRPIAACFALTLSFTTTLIAQVLGISLGPVDPTFPASAPPGIATMWFFMFTVGFTGIGMMAAPELLVPLARVLTWPVRTLSAALALPLALATGALLGLGIFAATRVPLFKQLVDRANELSDANPMVATAALLIITLGPLLLPKTEKDDDGE